MILIPDRITSSSQYPSKPLNRDYLLFADPGPLGWLSGVGDTVGAWLQLEWDQPVRIDRIQILNGWYEHADAHDWPLHGRVRSLAGAMLGTERCFALSVSDDRQWHWADGCGVVGTTLKLVVASIWPGKFNVVGLARLRIEGETIPLAGGDRS